MKSFHASSQNLHSKRTGKPYDRNLDIKVWINDFKTFNRSEFLNINSQTNEIEEKPVNEFLMIPKLRKLKQIYDQNKSILCFEFLRRINHNYLCSYENLTTFYDSSYK